MTPKIPFQHRRPLLLGRRLVPVHDERRKIRLHEAR